MSKGLAQLARACREAAVLQRKGSAAAVVAVSTSTSDAWAQHTFSSTANRRSSSVANSCANASSSANASSDNACTGATINARRGLDSLPLQLQDQIVLKGMAFYGYHGALPEENVLGQRFVVDATLWADLSTAGHSDKLQDTVDYSKAYSTIQQVVEGPARQLQEAVVEEVCQRLLALDTRVTAVQVSMSKPHVALKGHLESVGVKVFRQRLRNSP